MVDERDRARARLGLPPLAATPAAAPAPIVDEQTKARAMRSATPARTPASPASFRKFEETGQPLDTPVDTPVVDPVDTPVVEPVDTPSGIPSGFIAGPFPKELEQFFGSSAGILGYRIETLTDKKGRKYNQLSVATGPGSSKTFGAFFTQGADGKYSTFSPEGEGSDGGGGGGDGENTLGETYTAPDGTIFTNLPAYNAYIQKTKDEEKRRQGQSAYDLLFSEFDRYGMGALVEPLKQFIQDGISPAEFTLRLRETDAYKKRFAANAQRVGKGLRALSEAEYITMEDQYQNVMRQYGLPDTYYTRGEMGRQEGFEKFIAGDVSAVELEDRISTAQKRVLNANPEVTQAIKQFYPDITNADILAYTLDPKNAIENIKRKVTTAEIGGAFLQAGLQTGVSRADTLRAAGVTKETAQQGAGTIAGGLQRGSQLASIYGEDPYTQTTAETEVFNIAGAQDARKQRQKITGLEKATFGGQTGVTSSALTRDRAGGY